MFLSECRIAFLGLIVYGVCCMAIDEEEGRSLGLFKPYGGGQTVHYERYGGFGGGPFFKHPAYGGYESYTLSGGGFGKPFGKPFLGHGLGHGFGHGFGNGFGYPGFGYPGYGYPISGYGLGFGNGFGYFK